jgi:co-chaperonin GroES (HSP10)
MTTYQPLRNLVLLESVELPEEERGALIIPESAQTASAIGRVVARGPEAYESVQPGLLAFFQPVAALARWTEDGRDLVLIEDGDIFGVTKEKE